MTRMRAAGVESKRDGFGQSARWALAPVVHGVPRVLGCPWCHIRRAGLFVPRPKVTCAGCRFFERDLVNPAGGQGRCGLPGVDPRWHFPHERHACADWRLVGST